MLIIEAGHSERHCWRDLWCYRVFFFLAWRDILVRYKQTAIGSASAVIVSFIDFLISGAILFGLMLWHGFMPDWHLLALPLFMFMAFAAAMGGLSGAALNVK